MSVSADTLESNPLECKNITGAKLQRELNNIVGQAFESKEIDFQRMVDKEWEILKLDQKLDHSIDVATNNLKDNPNWFDKFQTNWSKEKIVKFSEEVTKQALESKELKEALNQLVADISRETTNNLEIISENSADLGLQCLLRFIGNTYSENIEAVFTEKTVKSLPDSDKIDKLHPDIDPERFITPENLTGALVLIGSVISKQVSKGIVERVLLQVGERLLGRLGTSVIPFVGELIGGGLIISDLYNSRNGALPEIQKQLKQPEVKEEFKTVIADTLDKEITQQYSSISEKIAFQIYSTWVNFKENYQQVLQLMQDLPEFKTIVDNYTTNQGNIADLTELLAKSHNNLSHNQVIEAIKDGTFEEALYLPQKSYKILERYTLYDLIKWANVAGNQIDKVVDLELYKHLPIQEIDKTFLDNLLAIPDELTISKLSILKVDTIRQLLKISTYCLVELSQHLSSRDFDKLASKLDNLNTSQINSLIRGLLENQSILNVLDHIVQSRNIDRAIEVWKTPNGLFSISTIRNIFSIANGAVSFKLLIDKYGNIITWILIAMLVLLATPVIFIIRYVWEILPKKAKIDVVDIPNKET